MTLDTADRQTFFRLSGSCTRKCTLQEICGPNHTVICWDIMTPLRADLLNSYSFQDLFEKLLVRINKIRMMVQAELVLVICFDRTIVKTEERSYVANKRTVEKLSTYTPVLDCSLTQPHPQPLINYYVHHPEWAKNKMYPALHELFHNHASALGDMLTVVDGVVKKDGSDDPFLIANGEIQNFETDKPLHRSKEADLRIIEYLCLMVRTYGDGVFVAISDDGDCINDTMLGVERLIEGNHVKENTHIYWSTRESKITDMLSLHSLFKMHFTENHGAKSMMARYPGITLCVLMSLLSGDYKKKIPRTSLEAYWNALEFCKTTTFHLFFLVKENGNELNYVMLNPQAINQIVCAHASAKLGKERVMQPMWLEYREKNKKQKFYPSQMELFDEFTKAQKTLNYRLRGTGVPMPEVYMTSVHPADETKSMFGYKWNDQGVVVDTNVDKRYP